LQNYLRGYKNAKRQGNKEDMNRFKKEIDTLRKKIKEPIKFEAMEEMMMDTEPTPKNIQIQKPTMDRAKELDKLKPPPLSQLLWSVYNISTIVPNNNNVLAKEILIPAILRAEERLEKNRIFPIFNEDTISNMIVEDKKERIELIKKLLKSRWGSKPQKGFTPMVVVSTKEEKDYENAEGRKIMEQYRAKRAPKGSKMKEVKKPIKFEAMEEMMMDTEPKSKNIQIKKPEPKPTELPKLSPELERAADPNRLSQLLPIRSEREDELLEMEEDELKDIINDNEIKFKKGDKKAMITAILKHEKIEKGTVLPEEDYDVLVRQHNILNLKNNKGDRSIYVLYRKLELDKEKVAQMRKKPNRDTSAELFEDLKIKRLMERISDEEEILLKTITKGKKGGSISAKDLKGLHASSYKEVPDKEVNGWVLDESISKPTARVYFNASKNQAIVVHRGTEGTLKDWSNNLAFVAGVSPLTQRYKDSKEVQEKAEAKYSDVLTTGHSQGSAYTKLAKNKKGIIDVNPASFIQSTEGTTVRAKNDPVSALRGIANLFSSKGKENITTSAKANLLDAHSINILDELGDKELGTGLTKYLKMLGKKGKKGKGKFEDFFKKTLPRALVKQGIPILGSVAGTALGSIAGPVSGAVGAEVGSKAGEVLSKYVSDKAGYGMKGGYLGQNPFPRSFGGGMTRHLKSLGK